MTMRSGRLELSVGHHRSDLPNRDQALALIGLTVQDGIRGDSYRLSQTDVDFQKAYRHSTLTSKLGSR